MSNYRFLRQGFSLRGVFVTRRFVSEGLDELISEYFDVGPSIGLEGVGGFLGLFPGAHRHPGVGVIGCIVFLGDDDGRVGISPEDSFVPHEVIVDEFAGYRVGYISSSSCSSGYYLYLFLGLTTFGAAENSSAIVFITYTMISNQMVPTPSPTPIHDHKTNKNTYLSTCLRLT